MHILITSIIDIEATPYSRLHHFIEHFLSKGHKVTLISIRDTWKHKGHRQNQELANKIEIRHVTRRDMGTMMQKGLAFFNSGRLLRGLSPDVHLAYNSLVLARIVSKKLKIRTVYDLADDLPDMVRTSPQIPGFLRPLAGYFSRRMLKRNLEAASVVTISAKEFQKSMGISRYNHVYIPNGVDTKRFRPRKDRHKGIVVGYVGALREWVDLRPMLTAVRNLKDYKIKVLVVGGEEDLSQYKRFAREQGIQKQVEFTGNVPYIDVPGYVNRMDICTMPFKKNRVTDGTCPLKVLEYMACEKPVISTELNEVCSMLGDRVLYATCVREWEKQICTLYHDGILREKLGRQGREFVQKNFNWKKICTDMEKVVTGV